MKKSIYISRIAGFAWAILATLKSKKQQQEVLSTLTDPYERKVAKRIIKEVNSRNKS